MNPEAWIQAWVAVEGRGQAGHIVYQSMNHRYHRVPINGDHPLGAIVVNGLPMSMDQWQLIETVGDGSCLIHAFLLSLSATYRGLSNLKKGQVGRAYRQYLFEQLSGPQSQRGTWAGARPYADILADLRSPRVNLQDELLSILCRFFHVGVIYITCSPYGALVNVESAAAAGRDYVMIANIGDGTHYEACVTQRDQFTVTRSVADAVERVQARLYDERAARQAADPQSDEAKRLRAFARLRRDAGAASAAAAVSEELTLDEQRALFDLEYIESGLTPAEIQSLWDSEHPKRPFPPAKAPPVPPAKAPPVPPSKAPPAADRLICESPTKKIGLTVEEARLLLRDSTFQPKAMVKEELCSALCELHRIDEWRNKGDVTQCNRQRFFGRSLRSRGERSPLSAQKHALKNSRKRSSKRSSKKHKKSKRSKKW